MNLLGSKKSGMSPNLYKYRLSTATRRGGLKFQFLYSSAMWM